jgi:hypothetical protein
MARRTRFLMTKNVVAGAVRSLGFAALLLGCVALPTLGAAQDQNDTPYVATRLIWRWRGIMNTALEESRAFASEAVIDRMEEFVSPGAVRAAQDKLSEEQLEKIDAIVQQFADAAIAAATRRDDGSRIVEEAAVDAAEKALCPVYPFCSK